MVTFNEAYFWIISSEESENPELVSALIALEDAFTIEDVSRVRLYINICDNISRINGVIETLTQRALFYIRLSFYEFYFKDF